MVGDPDCAVAEVDCSLAMVAYSELPRVVPVTAIVTTFADVVASLPFPVDSVVGDSSGVSWLVANKVATVVAESEVNVVGSWVVVVVVGDEILSVVSGKVVITVDVSVVLCDEVLSVVSGKVVTTVDVSVVVVTTIGYRKSTSIRNIGLEASYLGSSCQNSSCEYRLCSEQDNSC